MNRRVGRLLVGVVVPVVASSFVLAAEEPANPLFEQLRKDGVGFSAEMKAPLPAPLMADGLDADGQRTGLQKLVGKRFTVGAFTAKVGTAPHVYAIRKIAAASAETPRVVGVDVSFVAHGRLDTVAGRDFLENLHK